MGKESHKKQSSQGSGTLRRRAEDQLKVTTPETVCFVMDDTAQRLNHELQVHQVELELQNAELRQARDELETTLLKYSDLYEFAPVGYLTLDCYGFIATLNLSFARLVGIDRSSMASLHFGQLVVKESRLFFADFLEKVFTTQEKCSCELYLETRNDSRPFVRIDAIDFGTGQECRLAVIDCTARKRADERLLKAHNELEMRVAERTAELVALNKQLLLEVGEHKKSEEALKAAYTEVKVLKERLNAENIYLQEEIASQNNFGEIIGQSSAISYVFFRVEQVAPMDATVLLLGETGTGKGVIARAIHSRSARKNRPMITVNCSSLPANLIESELFGREKGAFTGANARQMGRFELADGGTIFLDEIGEMPLELQPKLLRVIQDGEFERLGSPRTIKVNVRIIAASNRNLEEEIRKGNFREDLFYRLNVFPITIPSLRQRQEDISLLVSHFVDKFNKKIGRKISTIPKDTLTSFEGYHWPGNVRELESVIERAVIISQGSTLEVLDRLNTIPNPEEAAGHNVKAIAELEHDHILQVLKKTSWRIEGKNGAAILLGLNASTLRARMRKFGIARQ